MTTAEAKATFTPEDLLSMPDAVRFELVDGQLVERNLGGISSFTGGCIYWFLMEYAKTQKAGWAWPADATFQCFPDAPDKVRSPDASFIRSSRLPKPSAMRGHIRVAPDLAVEVISPNDLAREVDAKVAEYLGAGVRLVWIINPDSRTVRVHRLDGTISGLKESDNLDGEDVLPGFRCTLRDIFPPPDKA